MLQPCPPPHVCTLIHPSRTDSRLPLCLHQLPCWPEPQKRCETCNGFAVPVSQSKRQTGGAQNPRYDEVIQSPNIPQPQYDYHIKYDANPHVESTAQMEEAKHDVFAQQKIGGLTLLEMTRHNQEALTNRLSPSGRLDFFYMIYAWITCQRVSAVIMPHNPMVTVSA